MNTSSGSATISILLRKNNGTFKPAISYNVGTWCYGVAINDFNNDSKPDVVSTLSDAVVALTYTRAIVGSVIGSMATICLSILWHICS